MKTRLTSMTYFGFTAMDRRLSNSMLPWLLREIRATGTREKLSIAIEDGCLKAYNENFEPVILHRLVDILRASQVPGRPDELFYILLNEKEGLLQCFLFRASTVTEVTDLFAQMRDPTSTTSTPKGSTGSLNVTKNAGFQHQNGSEHLPWASPTISLPGNCNSNLNSEVAPLARSVSNASALTSLCADLSPAESHFFEVLYIGKVRISQRKVPDTLIDDALQKFAQHEAEKLRLQRRHSLLSSTGTSISSNSVESLRDTSTSNENFQKSLIPSTTPLEPDKASPWKSAESLNRPEILVDKEFDEFTKERVERKPQESLSKNGKTNLGTVKEDEEKHDECNNPFKDIKLVKTVTLDPLLHISEADDVKSEDVKAEIKNDSNTKVETHSEAKEEIKDADSANKEDGKSMNFNELGRSDNGKGSLPENVPFLRDRSASIGTLNLKTPLAHLIGEQNRTMLFQVGRSELRLISPDRKQILLHRALADVASAALGRASPHHLGFVCRERAAYACYVFRCESDDVAKETQIAPNNTQKYVKEEKNKYCIKCLTIKQAFAAHAELLKKSREKSPNTTCEHCPMLWYHRLCHDVEGMNDKKTHAFILRRIETLPDDEQDTIITKYQGGTNHIFEVSEHNAFLMMLLRAHCEAKQQRHVHDTAENRSEFLNQYLGGSTIFMKAKRSLSSGFDHLLKRKQSKDDGLSPVMKKDPSPKPPPLNLETSSEPNHTELLSPDTVRCKSLSPAVMNEQNTPKTPPIEDQTDSKDNTPTVNSPMMDIFLKVSDSRPPPSEVNETDTTWRQAIYEKVINPEVHEGDPSSTQDKQSGKRTKEQLRQLWKMAIDQTLLLVRMEKENNKLKEKVESSAVRRIKLEYSSLGAESGAHMWAELLAREPAHPVPRVDRRMLVEAVRQGVPRALRGGVWYFLAEQACQRLPPADARWPRYAAPYRALLAGLTKHQHAILIDLGRTFPKHSYFASALGPGQLALYNILKAYSLLDPEVGYCQGLSFVAGVLLLHMEEAEAFMLLRHLMFRRGLRNQYLPDMSALQVQLYQLSRLVRDHLPELHARLEELDVPPALYAAPWMLTLFTSQFPLGFVVRVFENFPFQSAMEALTNYQKTQSRLETQNKLMEQHLTILSRHITNKNDSPAEIKKIAQNYTKKLSFSSKITSLTKFATNDDDDEKSSKQKSAPNLFAKTSKEDVMNAMNRMNEDRRHFLMKKSQSVHSGLIANRLKILEEKEPDGPGKCSLNDGSRRVEGARKHSLTDALFQDLGKRNSGFFASTHEQIRQERLYEQQLKHNFDENLRKLESNDSENTSEQSSDIFDVKTDLKRDLNEFQSRKSMSLNFHGKSDSGFVTPLTPDKELSDRKDETASIISHPLSDCCSDIDVKFDGQSTKLKQIRPIRHH
ncbi:uncharacterized protein LOC119838062 [Zerene cesonia]|uniref:uncharacterized protein LOC119838062 n=1 Tax=Zerene cesonia TaxID=33412 RepID=UPI0018E578E6|nr:uncharacterized protein LOC119838062 [Zerene cesonia]